MIKSKKKPEFLRVLILGIGKESITFLDRFVDGLAGNGVEVILATSNKPTKGRFLHSDRIKWLWAPAWRGAMVKRIVNLIALCVIRLPSKRIKWLKQEVASILPKREKIILMHRLLPFTRVKADIIYFPWIASTLSYQGLFRLGIPVVVSCRGSQVNINPHLPGKDYYPTGFQKSFGFVSAVHCVSNDILKESTKYGLDPQKAIVIRPAVDPQFFHPTNEIKENSQFVIVTTGTLTWKKGFEFALLAIHELVRNGVNCRYEIIGNGPEKSHILYTIEDLSLENIVILHGKLTPEGVLKRLQQADAFLLASLSEGISNAVLEAMSCALPVVTTDCGGMREAVTDGIEGFVVPIRDSTKMAGRLIELASDPVLRTRLGTAGRNRIIREFNINEQVNAFKNFLKQISSIS